MEKRVIQQKQFEFLRQEVEFYQNNQIIDSEQGSVILGLYDVKKKLSFITVLVVIGSILIGLGTLTFIASNWEHLGRIAKLSMIFGFLIGTSGASYLLSENYPKTSRSLLYLAVLIYGAGIFLIGQMFNMGGHFTKAFLFWMLGILPIAVLFKDKVIFAFACILSFVYLNGYFSLDYIIPSAIILIIPLLYYLNRFINYSKMITFFNNLLVLNTLAYFCVKILDKYDKLESWYTFIFILFLIIGVIMYYWPFKFHKGVFKVQGNILYGIIGFSLSFSYLWYGLVYLFYNLPTEYYYDYIDKVSTYSRDISVAFAIIFVIFLLFTMRKGNLISLVFTCAMILKFYFDISYDFMPKSLFFIIGGVILLGLGYFFERTRKKIGGIEYEKQEIA